MKRSLKVVYRKHDAIREEARVPTRDPVPGEIQAEQEIAQIEKKQSTISALNELARTISHYLNNPLTVLLGKVELLDRMNNNGGVSSQEVGRFVKATKREICRIDAIVKAFQDIGQVQHKTYPPGVKMLDMEREVKNRMKDTCFLR
jgi:signal transduction histidine kinase